MCLRRRIGLHVDRERTIGVCFKILVLRAEREAIDLVGDEEMLGVIDRERPESISGRRLIFREGHRIAVCAVEAFAVGVEILIDVLRFGGRIDENVGFGNCRAGEIVRADWSRTASGTAEKAQGPLADRSLAGGLPEKPFDRCS